MRDIIIIGGGIAGLTAALYAARFGRKVLVIEESNFGGQIVSANDIENYPAILNISGFELTNNLYNQAKGLNVEFVTEKVTKIENSDVKTVITESDEYECKSIIIASGMYRRKLNIENEDRLISKGISYCATCDGVFFKNKEVAIVGAGNTALEDAIFLSNYSKKVYVIHRSENLRGDQSYIDILKTKENVEFILNTEIIKIEGTEKLHNVIIRNIIDNSKKDLKIEGLFIAIGQIPNTEIYKDLIDLDQFGYVIANENCKTNVEGIFVAGDIRTKEVRQLVTATSDGAIASTKATNYVELWNQKNI